MSIKTKLGDMVHAHGLRLVLETLASLCAEEAERGFDEFDWNAWNKAKMRLLKMSQDMVI